MSSESEVDFKPGLKHWLFQILPPLLMLVPMFITKDGTGFVFLAGIFIFPALISILSILFKLFSFRRKKYYFLRPILTVLFMLLLIVVSLWSQSLARKQAVSVSESMLIKCNAMSKCPQSPDGWEIDGYSARTKLGGWYKYHASYTTGEHGFEMSIYYGPDYGELITGNIKSDEIIIEAVGD